MFETARSQVFAQRVQLLVDGFLVDVVREGVAAGKSHVLALGNGGHRSRR